MIWKNKYSMIILSFIVFISPFFLFINKTKSEIDSYKPSYIDFNERTKIGDQLELEFQENSKNINFLSSGDQIDSKNLEEEVLESIYFIENEIVIDYDQLQKINVSQSMIEIFETTEFKDVLFSSLEDNVLFCDENGRIQFDEYFMLEDEELIQSDDSLAYSRQKQVINDENSIINYAKKNSNKAWWVESKWYWFGYWKLKMNNEIKRIFENLDVEILLDICTTILDYGIPNSENIAILIAASNLVLVPELALIIAGILTVICVFLVSSYFLITSIQKSFRSYSGSAYLGIYAIIIVNWGSL